ncbi:helix-turn-helix domain-containing protein [Agreia sp. Leaf283]|uniref:helix-turn-helix domain-containing protein n=1 Tax=Agreia sp. Leaf283 TaxID=1736321 RepID=UPI0006F5933A|nr:helix-turn-helix domain-containing protein [Agreia sp. Leaf283]
MSARIDVTGVPPTDRLELLREMMARTRIPLEIHPSDIDRFRAHSRIADLGDLGVQTTRGSSAAIVRTPKLARDDAPPSLVIGLVSEGTSAIRHHGRHSVLRPGDITAYWSIDPYGLTFETDTVRHSFTISLDRLGLPASVLKAQLGSRVGQGSALQAIVSAHLAQLAVLAPRMTPAERRALEQPTIELIRALLASGIDDGRARGPLAETLELRIMTFLETHFDDPALDVAAVAHAHGISERYVQLLLARRNVSMGEWVRMRRLAAAAETLADPAQRLVTISAIAARWGFADHSHFTRSFRAAYGATPRAWREERLGR